MKVKNSFFLLLILIGCNCESDTQDIWISQGFFHNEVVDEPGTFILDLDKKELFDFNKRQVVDSLDLEKEILYDPENPYYLFYRDSIAKKMYYQSQKYDVCQLVFKKIEPTSKSIPLKEVLKNSWIRIINNKHESFSINETYNFSFPEFILTRDYFLKKEKVYTDYVTAIVDTLKYGAHVFHFIKGNNHISINQVTNLDINELTLFNYNTYYGKEINGNKRKRIKKGSILKNRFEVCDENEIAEYYYNGMGKRNTKTKREHLYYFKESYQFPIDSTQNGYIRIRFVVNCKGDTGRFSIQETDRNYSEKDFPAEITQQLFKLTSQLGGWLPKKWGHNDSADYNIHIGFKIKNGQIDEILP